MNNLNFSRTYTQYNSNIQCCQKKQGPQGVQGPTGPQGPIGPASAVTGPTGTSVWVTQFPYNISYTGTVNVNGYVNISYTGNTGGLQFYNTQTGTGTFQKTAYPGTTILSQFTPTGTFDNSNGQLGSTGYISWGVTGGPGPTNLYYLYINTQVGWKKIGMTGL
jgi:hypothetical protein